MPETAIVTSDTVETPTVGLTNTPTEQSAAPSSGTPTTADDESGVQPLFPTAEPDSATGTVQPAGEIIIILGADCPDPAWYNVDPNAGP